MKRFKGFTLKGFTLIELLVVIAIIALLISILLPSLSRARELSKRLVCQANMKGIGTSCKIYANDYGEKWPMAPFSKKASSDFNDGIDYFNFSPQDSENPKNGHGVAFERQNPSFSIPSNASTAISVTRSYWMLVRSGSVTPKQFICPSSTDDEDPTTDVELYYDFASYANISYGYQVPFGPRDTRPHEGMDSRMIIAADKGPFYSQEEKPDWLGGTDGGEIKLEDAPKLWRRYNSPNHGGGGAGEGQNCLFADGHATFEKRPCVGVDHDNIYTNIEGDWTSQDNLNLIHGLVPGRELPARYPGQESLGTQQSDYAATDSLIYP